METIRDDRMVSGSSYIPIIPLLQGGGVLLSHMACRVFFSREALAVPEDSIVGP